MKAFILSVANVRQDRFNTVYPNVRAISNVEGLSQAVKFDHMAGTFKNNRRANNSFISANCLIMDCDNGETDDASKWITPESIRKLFPDVEFYTCYSRNHMKQKNDKSPRPRFHIYFPLSSEITEAQKIRAYKEQLLKIIPDADSGAKDAARLIYGVKNPEIVYFSGTKDITSVLTLNESDLFTPRKERKNIPEGVRNITVYNAGIHYILTCETEEQAKFYFLQECKKCSPMLPSQECTATWHSIINSDAKKLRDLAIRLGNKEQFISQAKSDGYNAEKIKTVANTIFGDKNAKSEINRIAIKLLLKYKTEQTAREKFLKETSKYIDSLGIEAINALWDNAKAYYIVRLAFLARECKDNRAEYEKRATEIVDENDAAISSVWNKENGSKEVHTSFSGFLGKIVKRPLNIRVVEKALKDLGISARLNKITQKLEVEGIPQNNAYVSENFHKLSAKEQRRVATGALIGILMPYLQDMNYSVSLPMLKGFINTIANIQAYNPIEDMFKSQEWDGYDRISEIYKIMGISDNAMYCRLVKKWLIQAVAMALNDDGLRGCDFVLVLQGAQGVGKTEFFRNIAMRPEWFLGGADIDTRDKDSIISALTHWICEIGEADATFKHEQAQLKSFITANIATYRVPYGENYEERPRRTVFAATVNPAEFLKDTTGGTRRWATIRISRIDSAKMRALPEDWYIQMWVQVYNLFLQNNDGYRLADDERAFMEQENRTAAEPLKGETEVLEYLDWNADLSKWQYMTPSQFLVKTRITGLRPEHIGKALAKIAKYEKKIDVKRRKQGVVYLLPPLLNMEANLKISDADLIDTPENFEDDKVGHILLDFVFANTSLEETTREKIMKLSKKEQQNLIDRLELRNLFKEIEKVNEWLAKVS